MGMMTAFQSMSSPNIPDRYSDKTDISPGSFQHPRDRTPDDIIYDEQAYNYQLVRYGDGNDNVLLINVNTGAMWAIDTKGLTFTYKNTRLKYIPAVDAAW